MSDRRARRACEAQSAAAWRRLPDARDDRGAKLASPGRVGSPDASVSPAKAPSWASVRGATMSFDGKTSRRARRAALPVPRRRGRARPVLAARDRSRLAARGAGRQGNEGRLRRGRLRRLHGRAGAAEGAAGSPTSRSTPAFCCWASSTARSSSRSRISPRAATCIRVQQAMVDHHGSQCGFCTPGHRDEPVRRLSFRRARDRRRASATSSPAISAAAPAIARSSRRRSRPATARRPTASPRRPASAPRRSPRSPTTRTCSSATRTRFFAAPASLDSLAALYARFPDATLVGGATDVGLWITKQLRDLKRVIWLGRVAGLDAIGDSRRRRALARRERDARATPRRCSPRSIPTSASSCAVSARRRCG